MLQVDGIFIAESSGWQDLHIAKTYYTEKSFYHQFTKLLALVNFTISLPSYYYQPTMVLNTILP